MRIQLLEQVKWVGVVAFLLALVGVITLSSSNRDLGKQVDSLEDQISAATGQIVALKTTSKQLAASLQKTKDELNSQLTSVSVPHTSTKIAYLNAVDAFSVFTNAVSELRQKAINKQGEIANLQQQYMSNTISKDDFNSKNNQLQAELLQAQLNIDLGTIDKMIASSGFADMKGQLQKLKDEAQPVVDEIKNLISMMRVGVIYTTEFQTRYAQVKNAFTQLDQLLTQAATAKIVQAAKKIAVAQGYDLVLRTKNVIVYCNSTKLTDLTDLVKHEIASYL